MEPADRMEFLQYIRVSNVANVVATNKCDQSGKNPSLEGTLCVGGHHLIVSSRQQVLKELWLLHRNIDVMEKKSNNQNPAGSIILKCKDFRIYQLDINSMEDLNNVLLSLENLTCLDQSSQYPFFYRSQSVNNATSQVEDGWTAFAPVSEWSKLLATHADEWRICYVNRDYKVCGSYPSAVIVPRQIDDKVIVLAANFRDGGRFPVLCYRHDGGSILLRSSQPMSGPTGKRCKEDERLLNAVLGPGRRGYIVDTRSASQAQVAKNRGGGTEIDAAYPQWRKVHKPIPRTSELADSFCKLVEACNDSGCSVSQWLSRLENSGWLTAVQSALNAACVAAQCLHHETAAVLVHGGAGRDCTLVVTSLSQVILNPDCRTIRGLQALVEREWLQAGHPFFSRTRRGPYHPSSQGSSHAPTFLLFLDCLYQLLHQFQFSFEYTSALLAKLYKHAYSSNYGTFLGDSESERVKLRLSERTVSLWSYVNQPDNLQKWLNPLYEPNPGVIWPSIAPVSMKLWSELYLWHTGSEPWGGAVVCAAEIKRNYTAVRKLAGQLRAKVRKGVEELHSRAQSSIQMDNTDEHLRISQLTLEAETT